ncbi:unnamed protein product, partial [Echinostoma caproni]|uniref:1-phosphatidylinositol 4-kinase n=1 Tax=Echinostoma caproni TaxID=27848 RepID=A0A183AV51_9TREM
RSSCAIQYYGYNASEIERLSVWFNPQSLPDRVCPKETEAATWLRDTVARERNWNKWASLAWELNPAVAIYLPQRDWYFRLRFVAYSVLTWAPVAPIVALSFFSRMYPQHPLTHQYAVRVLANYPSDTMIFYVPQLVQGLRYDKLGYLTESLLESARRSPLLAHQLLWNINTNMYLDEDGEKMDPDIGTHLATIRQLIIRHFTGPALAFYKREFEFFDQITGISGTIRLAPKGPARQKACLEALRQIAVRPGCYLPSNPDAIVLEIDYQSGTPMQSAAKAPFLARFKVFTTSYNVNTDHHQCSRVSYSFILLIPPPDPFIGLTLTSYDIYSCGFGPDFTQSDVSSRIQCEILSDLDASGLIL